MTVTIGEGAGLQTRDRIETKRRGTPGAFRERLGPVAVFAMFIGLWYLTSYWAIDSVFNKPRFLVPPPHEVINESFVNNSKIRTEMLRGVWLSSRSPFLVCSSPSCWG